MNLSPLTFPPTIMTNPTLPLLVTINKELQVKRHWWLDEKFRAEINAWLCARFPSEPFILYTRGSMPGQLLIMHPANEAFVRAEIEKIYGLKAKRLGY